MYRVNWQNPFTRNGEALPSRLYETAADAHADMRQDPPLADHCTVWAEPEGYEPWIIASRLVRPNGHSQYWPA